MKVVGSFFKLLWYSVNLCFFDVERMVGNLVNVNGNFVVFFFFVVIVVIVDGKEGMLFRLFMVFVGFIFVFMFLFVMRWLVWVYIIRGVVICCCCMNYRIMMKVVDLGKLGMFLEGLISF